MQASGGKGMAVTSMGRVLPANTKVPFGLSPVSVAEGCSGPAGEEGEESHADKARPATRRAYGSICRICMGNLGKKGKCLVWKFKGGAM
jgi:hypothetical protein